MIDARIQKKYPARQESAGFALDVEFTASAGVTVLFGASGAGKTLTLDSIAGFVKPDAGRILLDDGLFFDGATDVHLPPQRRRCGYVFQNYALFPHMTLRANLAFAAERLPRLVRHRKVNEMLETFRLTDVSGRRPHELSGGQRQRGSIARALIGEPRLLLLDEPARGLDAPLREELYVILRQVREQFQLPVLLVTHDLDECFALAEEMVILDRGRVVQTGSPRQIVDRPKDAEVARLLGLFNLIPAEITFLDPQNNRSKLRIDAGELHGPYYPGQLLGDRVSLCVRHSGLRARPRDGRPEANQVAAQVVRAIDRPGAVLVEFTGNLYVEMSRSDFELSKHNRDWVVEFPSGALNIV